MADRSLHLRPITGALGTEIAWIDFAKDFGDAVIAAIRRAWLDHLVIFRRVVYCVPLACGHPL